MTRQLILVILAFNAAVIAIGIIAYLLIHQSHRAVDAEELQRRVSEGLASVTTLPRCKAVALQLRRWWQTLIALFMAALLF